MLNETQNEEVLNAIIEILEWLGETKTPPNRIANTMKRLRELAKKAGQLDLKL
jgi:hypothetical protein